MPKPSVALWSAKPTTKVVASNVEFSAAAAPIPRPSAKLCRPMPIAISMASLRPSITASAFTVRRSYQTMPSRPMPTPANISAPYPKTWPRLRLSAGSAASIGSQAALSTSQTRNMRTPTARADRKWRTFGRVFVIRPTGRPRTIVPPAIRPRIKVCAKLIPALLGKAYLQCKLGSAVPGLAHQLPGDPSVDDVEGGQAEHLLASGVLAVLDEGDPVPVAGGPSDLMDHVTRGHVADPLADGRGAIERPERRRWRGCVSDHHLRIVGVRPELAAGISVLDSA